MEQQDITISSILKEIQSFFKAENFINNLPFIAFVGVLGLFYIANSNYHLQLEREIDRKEKEVKHLSWEYMTSKSEVMYSSKQSEIAKSVAPIGLKPLVEPPQIIEINE